MPLANSCCFFMSLRFGAATMATLQLILSVILTIALWREVSIWNYDVGIRLKGTAAAAATYYTILSFSASLGCLSILTRSKGILRYFAFCLGWSLGLQLAVSALQLWGFLSTPRTTVVAKCAQVPGQDAGSCMRSFSLSVGWLLTSIIAGLLVQLCSAYVVSSYASQLSEEDEYTDQAPAPGYPNVSAPQLVNAAVVPVLATAPTFVSTSEGKEKEWDSSSSSEDSHGGADEKDELRIDPGPPQVPMLDPAPPKRVRRVYPKYPAGTGPGSADSASLSAESRTTPDPFSRFSETNSNPSEPSSAKTLADSTFNQNAVADAAKMV